MKNLRPTSLRLLPCLLFQASTTLLKTSAFQASAIVSNKASCTPYSDLSVLHRRTRYQFTHCSFYLHKQISKGNATRRKLSMARTEDKMVDEMPSDSAISASSNSLVPSPSTGAFPTLCPKCRGEGKLSRAPSKKARLRQQRRLYQQEQEQRREQENVQQNNHKRSRQSLSTTTTPRTAPVGSSETVMNSNNVEFRKSELPTLPRRWDPCPKCDQTGLLMPLEINSTGRSSSDVTHTYHRPFVAIVGGGIGGIALAVALRHRGIPFMVYEKDSRFDQRRQGYGLTLQQARRALQALGIFENNDDGHKSTKSAKLLQEHAVTSTKHVVHTPDGKQVGEWGLRKWVGDANGPKNNGKNLGEESAFSDEIDSVSDVLSPDQKINNTKLIGIDAKSWGKNTCEANWKTSARTKQRPTRANNKKRRQNLHVPRQTLRYALLEALKEASGIRCEEAAPSKTGIGKARNRENLIQHNHSNINISWGHKLVSIESVTNGSNTNDVQLSFEVADEYNKNKRIVTAQASLVVGCDGIRSSVRERLIRVNAFDNDKQNKTEDSKRLDVSATALRYLNCVVILGICPLGDLFPSKAESERVEKRKQIELSPLLDGETVFQTADGTTRIYLMPYSEKDNEYMWQLSFPVVDEELAIALSRRGSKALKEEALRRCRSWHVPIPEILEATPIELVSGYPVYDRDILTSETLSTSRRDLSTRIADLGDGNQKANDDASSRIRSSDVSGALPVTLLGDAAHPMSPFKGQGANQALLDALSLARALYRIHCLGGKSLGEALEFYENEMLNRSAEKVRASSDAARFLHTDIAIQEGDVTRGAAFNSSCTATSESKV